MMTTEQTRKFISEYFDEIINNYSEATLDKYVNDPQLKGHIVIFQTGIPNYKLNPQDLIVEGNKVCARFKLEGVHKGELFGIAPSGNQVSVDGIIIYEVENNKIVNHWMQTDTVALMQQIGASVDAMSGH
jgi:predicted ester cyclase